MIRGRRFVINLFWNADLDTNYNLQMTLGRWVTFIRYGA